MTLFVAVFVFFLIFVFTYMDDLIGKGLGTWVLIQFFVYSWITFIPQSIPLAVLLSSIMTFGNLAENYELAAMKSAGLSLLKIIRPIILFIFLLAGITFVFNNYTLPYVTLKSSSLLWDIRQAKPALNIKKGIFYNQLEGYSIRVGEKDNDGKTIRNVMVYDHTAGMGNNVQIYANKGHMETTPDTSYLVIRLYDGNRYEDIYQEDKHRNTRPLSRLNFKTLEVKLDMTGFKKKQTSEELFKGHHEMMNIWQIDKEIDTFKLNVNQKYTNLHNQAQNYFFARTLYVSKNPKVNKVIPIDTFYHKLSKADHLRCIENAQNMARSASTFIDSVNEEIRSKDLLITEYVVGWHKKINVSFACIVLFFVGAPLGAIIRKGGLGLPVVVAIMFFLIYYVVSITYERLVLENVYPPLLGMWLPLVVFLPIGFFLTYKAATDSAIFDFGLYTEPIKKVIGKLIKRKAN